MQSYNDLQSQLKTIDHKSYPLYKSLRAGRSVCGTIGCEGDSGCEGSRIPGICDEG